MSLMARCCLWSEAAGDRARDWRRGSCSRSLKWLVRRAGQRADWGADIGSFDESRGGGGWLRTALSGVLEGVHR